MLRRPAGRVGPCGTLPHRIPFRVFGSVREEKPVTLDPRDADGEAEGRAVIEIAVERDVEGIRRHLLVAAGQAADDPAGMCLYCLKKVFNT